MMRAQLKRKLIVTLTLPVLGLSASAVLAAGDYGKSEPRAAAQGQRATMPSAMHDVRASKLIGMDVHNAQGEDLGEINDLVVDVNNERVHYAVLGFGGALGLGEKLFAYPVSMFSEDSTGKKLTLKVDKEKLKSAPGFERSAWPDWEKDKYRADVERHFGGATARLQTLPNQRLARASDLIGKNVDDRNGKHAGEIEDLVVNLGNGRIHYAVLDFDKAWSADDKLLPVALKSFQFPADRTKDMVLNLDRNQLDMARGFTEDSWPDIADATYQREIDAYLGRGHGVAGQPGPVMRDK